VLPLDAFGVPALCRSRYPSEAGSYWILVSLFSDLIILICTWGGGSLTLVLKDYK